MRNITDKPRKTYRIEETRIRLWKDNISKIYEGTLEELTEAFSYTLECGHAYQNERGNKRIDLHPKTIKGLIRNLNNAISNSCTHYPSHSYTLIGG